MFVRELLHVTSNLKQTIIFGPEFEENRYWHNDVFYIGYQVHLDFAESSIQYWLNENSSEMRCTAPCFPFAC